MPIHPMKGLPMLRFVMKAFCPVVYGVICGRTSEERYDIARIVVAIQEGKMSERHYLSTSTRGEEDEVVGFIHEVKRTVRGLTLVLNNKRKVVWACPKRIADSVFAQVA